ncbi:hypothetical protein FN846DRAFT_908590 [Sphaerosporella brunnea]|uniref:UTP--glucose-1-phosphate uridylyltransferase n=1 Tax=Sphaerosporella brunnea TaxID=1250544 RepID=A0A5J5ET75_9PEZI|nr:hypothetical protein FN846DRAFT_908590 [Sphaerosporella brunnea]
MQIQDLNRIYGVNMPLILMNSFNTDCDTANIIKKHEGHNIYIITFNWSRYPRDTVMFLSLSRPRAFWATPTVETEAKYIPQLRDRTKVKGGTIIDYEGTVLLLAIRSSLTPRTPTLSTCPASVSSQQDLLGPNHEQLMMDSTRLGPAPPIKLGYHFKKVADFEERASRFPRIWSLTT